MSARFPVLTSTRRTSVGSSKRQKLKSTLPDSPFLPKIGLETKTSTPINDQDKECKYINPDVLNLTFILKWLIFKVQIMSFINVLRTFYISYKFILYKLKVPQGIVIIFVWIKKSD